MKPASIAARKDLEPRVRKRTAKLAAVDAVPKSDHLEHSQGEKTLRHARFQNSLTQEVNDLEATLNEHALVSMRLSSIVRDISERKSEEEARQASEARYHTLFDNAPDGILIADSRSYYIDANASMCRMLGYSREELIGLHASDIVTESEVQHIGPALSVIEGGSAYHREWQFRRKDRSIFPAEVIATMMPDGNLLGMIRDITGRKRTEQALRESEERLRFLNDLAEATRTLADPAQIMAVMARTLGEHLRASRCAYADVEPGGEQFTILHDYANGCASTVGHYQLSLFGARAVATLRSGQTLIIGNVGKELLPGDGADMFNAIGIQAIITCPLVKNGELRAMMAVHQTSPRDWKPEEITLVQNVVERCWATIERRTAEEKIHQLNAELEQSVAKRTAQLEMANRGLEVASRAKSDFLASMSHELRTPLNGIIGFAEFLVDGKPGPLNPKQKEYLEDILNSGQHLLQLINDVLDLAKVEAGKMEFYPETFSFRSAIAEVCAVSRPMALKKHLQVEIDIAPGLKELILDQQKFKQVLFNLLSNAIKFTPDHGRIDILAGPAADCRFQLSVKDTGIGIKPEDLPRLFTQFEQLESGATRHYEGTGLGLALTRKILELQGGGIAVQSEFGTGTTFTVTLPLVIPEKNYEPRTT